MQSSRALQARTIKDVDYLREELRNIGEIIEGDSAELPLMFCRAQSPPLVLQGRGARCRPFGVLSVHHRQDRESRGAWVPHQWCKQWAVTAEAWIRATGMLHACLTPRQRRSLRMWRLQPQHRACMPRRSHALRAIGCVAPWACHPAHARQLALCRTGSA